MNSRKHLSPNGVLAMLFFAVASCSPTSATYFELSGDCYIVPRKNILKSGLLSDSLKMKMDHKPTSVHLVFDPQYVSDRIVEFRPVVEINGSSVSDTLTAVVLAVSKEDLEYIASGEHDEALWNATGSYSEERLGRTIEWDEHLQLFRVGHRQISSSWVYTDIDPSKTAPRTPSSEHIIAGCFVSASDTPSYFTCLRTLRLDQIQIQYWLTEHNFPLYPAVDDFLSKELSRWRVGSVAEGACRSRSDSAHRLN